ncbi:unnamed protein product [Musa acuminata subsp. burmannicoides]
MLLFPLEDDCAPHLFPSPCQESTQKPTCVSPPSIDPRIRHRSPPAVERSEADRLHCAAEDPRPKRNLYLIENMYIYMIHIYLFLVLFCIREYMSTQITWWSGRVYIIGFILLLLGYLKVSLSIMLLFSR